LVVNTFFEKIPIIFKKFTLIYIINKEEKIQKIAILKEKYIDKITKKQ
jgi:hypothetical protein